MKINSVDYWNHRFETDWNECDGNGQTIYFANTLCNMLPQWLTDEVNENKYSVCDLGCADGDALPIWNTVFKNSDIYGEDFAEKAVENARKKYPEFMCLVSDIMKPEGQRLYDVVISSNTVEHFKDTKEVLRNICKRTKKYTIIMLPYREDDYPTDEHEVIFHTDNIPCVIDNNILVYAQTYQCNSKYYIAEQILLIYSKEPKDYMLSDIVEYVNSDSYKKLEKKEKLIDEKNKNLEKEVDDLKENQKSLNDELNTLKGESTALQESNVKLQESNVKLQESNVKLQESNVKLQESNVKLQGSNEKLQEEKGRLQNKIENCELMLESSERKRITLETQINQAIMLCNELTNWGLYKFSHLLHRTKHQLFNRSDSERKSYIHWITGYLKGKGTDADSRFKPICRIADTLRGQGNNLSAGISNSQLGNHISEEKKRLNDGNVDLAEVEGIKEVLRTHEYKGILVYPHVVYWEPLQTPQQLLRSFAKLGWLCFFCEHPNLKDVFREVEENVIIVHEKEFLYAIGDQEVVVLLTWLGSYAFVEQIRNKEIWYHVLDKLSLFPYYDDKYLEFHNRIVSSVNYISYVAKPLLDCIHERQDAVYLPNGVNPDEFMNIHEDFIPDDMSAIIKTGHKIIGYYGYIAEWMDYEMIRRIALVRPDYEFVFIGKAIYDTSLFDGIKNIHLLGLKPYKELSDYAKLFDVAIIPFVVNEAMDCVSPIKFYEYCALGLPVITSKMNEMEKYVCEYIACADGYDEFLFYLDKLTDKKYKDMANKRAPYIAEDNTWFARAKCMECGFNKEIGLVLGQNYTNFDVIILSVIDYDFRFQRPQQLAVRYAQNGHRVFYFNANHFNDYSECEPQKNLHVINIHNDEYSAIHLTDWSNQRQELMTQVKKVINSYCIRDAIVIVDYPNWIYLADALRSEYGFKVITDYMDDYTGFLSPAEELVRQNCKKLLQMSDGVIVSSQFLYDIAAEYNKNVEIVRNGTEFKHFNAAFGNIKKERKIIGYYGAVAEWFQTDKVVYLANKLPECDIVIIGHVTRGEADFRKCSNIKLLGEKPYEELPEYLKDFDVCIIPFDTSTDLIKATNPVKFYEYLSAGKKVVSTEIPELEEYRDKYVYMANENEKFSEYVKECLAETDILCHPDECIAFAREHDWQERYERFYAASKRVVPKISIIVLTYNNLEINKLCIKSILEKTAYPNYELIVVDNCSTDGTREYLVDIEKKNKNVKVILNSQNVGFAAGNNIGMKEAKGDYIVLLNNDTVVTRGWLTAMAKHLENDQSLGMCGPVTNSIGNEAKIRVNYHSMGELERFSYNYTLRHLNEEYRDVNVLALFCTMIRKKIIAECGYLDETYGIGMFEDDDYSELVKTKGYSLVIAEDAFIHHFEGASFKKLEDEEFMKIFNENKQKFEEKWSKKWTQHKKRSGINEMTNNDIIII